MFVCKCVYMLLIFKAIIEAGIKIEIPIFDFEIQEYVSMYYPTQCMTIL